MTTIKQADREAAADWNIECKWCSEYEGDYEADLAEAFARHREAAEREALERALKALKSAKYSPAPYTDGVKAIRALCPTPRPDDSEADGPV